MKKVLLVAILMVATAVQVQGFVTLNLRDWNGVSVIANSGAIAAKTRGVVGGAFIGGAALTDVYELGAAASPTVVPNVNYDWRDGVRTSVRFDFNTTQFSLDIGGTRIFTVPHAITTEKVLVTIESLNYQNDGMIRLENLKFDGVLFVSSAWASGVTRSSGFEFSKWSGAQHRIDFDVFFSKGTGEFFQYPEFDALNFEIALLQAVPEPTSSIFLMVSLVGFLFRRRRR